jgi:hypothetical protein
MLKARQESAEAKGDPSAGPIGPTIENTEEKPDNGDPERVPRASKFRGTGKHETPI